MLDWVNKLFRKNTPAPAPAPAPAPVAVAGSPPAPASGPMEQEDDVLPPYLVEKLLKFGYEDFFTRESNTEPHVLQAVVMKRDNYLHQLFSAADRIIDEAYEEPGYGSSVKDYEVTKLKPPVAAFLRKQDSDTRAAFDTLFDACKKYMKSVDEMQVDGSGNKTVTVAKNAPSNAEAAGLQAALVLIWKAVPEANPYVAEGIEYIMEHETALAEAFKGYWWTKNDRRSDWQIADQIEARLQQGEGQMKVPAAIAAQTADNMTGLKAHAAVIAERHLAWCISRTLEIDDAWNVYDKSPGVARQILAALAQGATPAEQAKALQNGAYGPAKVDKEDPAKQQHCMDAAEKYIALAQEVSSGAWFDARRARLLQVSEAAQMTLSEREEKMKEKRAREAEEVARGATVLGSAVSVKHPLQLKRGPR